MVPASRRVRSVPYRPLLPVFACAVLLAPLVVLPSAGQQASGPLYNVIPENQARVSRDHQGQPGVFVTLQFTIKRGADSQLATDVLKQEIVVMEDRRPVTELDIQQPGA